MIQPDHLHNRLTSHGGDVVVTAWGRHGDHCIPAPSPTLRCCATPRADVDRPARIGKGLPCYHAPVAFAQAPYRGSFRGCHPLRVNALANTR